MEVGIARLLEQYLQQEDIDWLIVNNEDLGMDAVVVMHDRLHSLGGYDCASWV